MKRIPLSQGQFALVDDKDFERLSKFKWHAHWDGYNFYAIRTFRISKNKQGRVRMHQELFECPEGMIPDHKDGDGLNNQRENLRPATYQQNNRNRRKKARATSRFKGVSWRSDVGKWRVIITLSGKLKSLGSFLTERKAARAYDEAARRLFGEFAHLNFH